MTEKLVKQMYCTVKHRGLFSENFMYAKVFGQIFDSSIAGDYEVRHVFTDLLVLSDSDGVVDMTLDAIARRTNVPIEVVSKAIKKLCDPDPASRSKEEEGRRLKLIDSHRDWGWQIVNYAHYRDIRDEEGRRRYFRDYQRERRLKLSQPVKDKSHLLNEITHANASPCVGSIGVDSEEKGSHKSTTLSDYEWLESLKKNPTYAGIDVGTEFGKASEWVSVNPKRKLTKRFFINWLNRIEKPLTSTTEPKDYNAWTPQPKD